MATGCEAIVGLSLYKRTQIGYTQYVDNDVYVDDVDDDEAGAGAFEAKENSFSYRVKWSDNDITDHSLEEMRIMKVLESAPASSHTSQTPNPRPKRRHRTGMSAEAQWDEIMKHSAGNK